MNKVHDYRELEREFVTSHTSIRELCRRHSISAHSSVVVQAKKHKRQEKREAYQGKESDSFMTRHAERSANRLAEISDMALDTIEEAITKFREDMRATKSVRQPDGSIREEPVMRLMPKDVAVLLDRLQIPFDRSAHISEGRDLRVRSEIPLDARQQFVHLTRGRAVPSTSPLPRPRRLDG